MRKLFSLFLVIAASVGTMFASVTINGLNYDLNETEKTVKVAQSSFVSGDLVIPSSVTYNSVTYSVTSIGSRAFSSCSGLTSVTIPNSVTSIGYRAFSNCSGLTSIIVENGNTVYDSRNDCNAIIETATNTLIAGCQSTIIPNSVTSIGYDAFYNCSGLTSVTIPNSVTSIGEYAFYGCSGLTTVTIPNSVTSISEWAFRYCTNLTSITMEAETPPTLGADAFDDTNDCPIYVPCGTLDAYKSALRNYESRVKYEPLKFTITGNVNIESAGVVLLPQNNCESTIITAQPDTGYYFVQWSDGVTDNPRTIELTQDTILTALFDSIPAGQDTTATEIKNDSVMVSATPTEDNSVILEWPAVEGADTYTITIYKNDELICTLVFDAEGHLISIRFAAPARDGNGRNIPVAEQAANGWRYVVTGMQPNTTYAYSVVAKDENGNVLLSESIDFTMPEPLSVDNIDSSSLQGGDRGRLILHNGQIYILRGDKTYRLQGQEVK